MNETRFEETLYDIDRMFKNVTNENLRIRWVNATNDDLKMTSGIFFDLTCKMVNDTIFYYQNITN
jgi:hypothetical protein